MYVLIADSGSTKTDWVLLQGNQVVLREKTMGFNPYFQSKDEISEEIRLRLKPLLLQYLPKITVLFYYGAGCSTTENCEHVKSSIGAVLPLPAMEINHDLLAAARALCGREWGIAAILGTGSNSCLYNGKDVVENIPSVGYLWGDHGSGAQIGKFLVRDYFENRLPEQLKAAFEAAGYNREEILNNVYKKSLPSRYLASVSLFVDKFRQHPYVQALLAECFDSFFKQQVGRYTHATDHAVHTVGSVGYFYKDIIARVAQQNGYRMGKVIQSPMEGLIDYHSQQDR